MCLGDTLKLNEKKKKGVGKYCFHKVNSYQVTGLHIQIFKLTPVSRLISYQVQHKTNDLFTKYHNL